MNAAVAREVSRDLAELVGVRIVDVVPDASGRTSHVDTGYVIESVLGSGGMGVAFLAQVAWDAPDRPSRPPPGTRCVIKVLLPEVVVREARVAQLSFKKEVVALARLAEKKPPSPFVVRWLDAGFLEVSNVLARARGVDPVHLPWCAVELVDGRPLGTTLEERLSRAFAPLEPARAASLIEGIVRGVRVIHAAGLVHRDLKPGNVLVCGEPPHELPKITDFGVARASGLGDTFDVTVGTTGYCALEQLEGRRAGAPDPIGPWSDVFAIGAMAYEILTREAMYDAPNAMAFVGKVLSRDFAPLATRDDLGDAWRTDEGRALAAQWDRVLARATSPRSPGGGTMGADPSHPLRHRSVDELLDELEPLLEATRALGRYGRATSVPRSIDVAFRRWDWSTTLPAPRALTSAALRSDGVALASSNVGLVSWDGAVWSEFSPRGPDDGELTVFHGGAGTFVVVHPDGEIEVLPGGFGGYSFRLPFGVRRATALAGHPLGTAFLAVHAAHGDWLILRLHGRAASPFARLGQARIAALTLGVLGDEEVLVAAGSVREGRGDESFCSVVDRHGRVAALPPLPGTAIDVAAFDAEGSLLLAGSDGAGRIDRTRRLVGMDDHPPMRLEAMVALPDGQVWGFAQGLAMRRSSAGSWTVVHAEPSLMGHRVLAASASGARVWALHDDGRTLVGKLALGTE